MSQQTLPTCLFKGASVKAEDVRVKLEPGVGSAETPRAVSAGAPDARSLSSGYFLAGASQASSADTKNGAKAVAENKKRYNKFAYRMTSAAFDVKEHYKMLLKKKDHKEIEKFMDDIISFAGHIPNDYLVRKRSHSSEEGTDTQVGWISFKEAADRDGEEVVLEMIEAGTIPSRKNPKLPPSSKVPYPKNMQVKYSVEKEVTHKRTRDETQLHEHHDPDAEAHEEFLKGFAKNKVDNRNAIDATRDVAQSSGLSSCSSDGTGSAPAKLEDEKAKLAVQAIRKAHNSCDRAVREFDATVKKSSNHHNTKGCKFESDLKTIIRECRDFDDELVKLEAKYMQGLRFDDEDITMGAATVTSLQAKIKEGNKKVAAIKPWFKL